jgi:hypothetical protein
MPIVTFTPSACKHRGQPRSTPHLTTAKDHPIPTKPFSLDPTLLAPYQLHLIHTRRYEPPLGDFNQDLNTMAQTEIPQKFSSSTHSFDYECALCMELFDEEHAAVTLDNCRHIFGKECLMRWINSKNARRNKCPTCRAVLFNGPRADRVQPNAVASRHYTQGQPGPRPPAQQAPVYTAHGLLRIHEYTQTVHRQFCSAVPNMTMFYTELWRDAACHLAPMYLASGKIITPELDIAARRMLVNSLNRESVAIAGRAPEHRYRIQQSLPGAHIRNREYYRLVTRKLVQVTMVIVMLSSLIPMEVNIVTGCFALLSNDPDATLGYDFINAAIAHPSAANVPLLKVLTYLLLDKTVEQVCKSLGQQWHITAGPAEMFLDQTMRVKDTLNSRTRLENYFLVRTFAGTDYEILKLWRRPRSSRAHGPQRGHATTGTNNQVCQQQQRPRGFRERLHNFFRRKIRRDASAPLQRPENVRPSDIQYEKQRAH